MARGRVVHELAPSPRFTIYADKQAFPHRSGIVRAFHLPPERTQMRPDDHYRSTRRIGRLRKQEGAPAEDHRLNMWIMLSDSFLSIVAFRGNPAQPDKLLVRGRVRGDIERMFPASEVVHTPRDDYAFRALLPRHVVATAVSKTHRSNRL